MINVDSLTNINLDKWFEIIAEDETFYLNDYDGLIIDTISKTQPNGNTQTTKIESLDGEIPDFTTYGEYDLEVEMLFRGIDKKDVDLFIFKINNKLSKRVPYYVRHSDLPFIKFAVYPSPKIETTKVTRKDWEIKITFTCYKGYSESYKTVKDMNFLDDNWQFEQNLKFDNDIKYEHTSENFDIYNGSSDTIDPSLNHFLKIVVNANAKDGITIKNNTTGDEIIYKSKLKKDDDFVIDGVYPFVNGNRVGRYTNFEWLTLAKGYNNISVLGTDVNDPPNVKFDFNFIFK